MAQWPGEERGRLCRSLAGYDAGKDAGSDEFRAGTGFVECEEAAHPSPPHWRFPFPNGSLFKHGPKKNISQFVIMLAMGFLIGLYRVLFSAFLDFSIYIVQTIFFTVVF